MKLITLKIENLLQINDNKRWIIDNNLLWWASFRRKLQFDRTEHWCILIETGFFSVKILKWTLNGNILQLRFVVITISLVGLWSS